MTTDVEPTGKKVTCASGRDSRTTTITLRNNYPGPVVLWLVQCVDTTGIVIPDCILDTGTIVASTNVQAGAAARFDPCSGGPKRPIQANLLRGSIVVRWDGQDVTHNLQDIVAPPGQAIGENGWTVYTEGVPGATAGAPPALKVSSEPIFAPQNKS